MEWQTLAFGKRLFTIAFILINVLAIVFNFNKIGNGYNPSFIANINRIWFVIWTLIGGTKLFDFIFRRRNR